MMNEMNVKMAGVRDWKDPGECSDVGLFSRTIAQQGGYAMKRMLIAAMVVLLVLVGLAYAQERIASVEAKALLNKAVAYYKTNGQEKAFAAFNDRKGQFVDQELYIFALDMNGKVLAHGIKPALIGKDMTEIRDADEKNFIKEIVEVVKTQGEGVVRYKWENPKSLAVEQKSSYVERVNGVILGCGYYK